MSLPEPIIALPASFQPVFTNPTWQKVLVLHIGTLMARGHRTVTVALRQMGLEQSPKFSKYHHLLNRARWSPLHLSRCMLNVLVERFVQAGGSLELVIDETLGVSDAGGNSSMDEALLGPAFFECTGDLS